MALQGVIFDVGGTIVEYDGARGWEWPGLDAFRETLVRFGHDAPTTEACLAVHEREVENFYQRLELDPHANHTHDEIFSAILAEAGVTLTPAQWDEARTAYYRASHAHVRLVPGIVETVRGVVARGLRVGVVSNTTWPGPELDRLLDNLGVGAHLPVRFYSADEAAWKPWPHIFERALAALGLAPAEAAYVGDVPAFDVRGAQCAGMRAVWLNRRGRPPADGLVADATIGALPDLLPVVDRWMAEP